MGSLGHELSAKLDEISEILSVENVMLRGIFPASLCMLYGWSVRTNYTFQTVRYLSSPHVVHLAAKKPKLCMHYMAFITLESKQMDSPRFHWFSQGLFKLQYARHPPPWAFLNVEAEQHSITNQPEQTPEGWLGRVMDPDWFFASLQRYCSSCLSVGASSISFPCKQGAVQKVEILENYLPHCAETTVQG